MTILYNCRIVTGASSAEGALAIEGSRIAAVWTENAEVATLRAEHPDAEFTDLGGKVLMAGGIDAHVHFREPGATHKGDMQTESRAALLGGITSVLDMPNNNPPATSLQAIRDKADAACGRMWTNYGFHIGVTNSNADEIEKVCAENGNEIAGIKLFLGSSTGNMLVDDGGTLDRIFRIKSKPVLIHSEDEGIIRANLEKAKEEFGENIPMEMHPQIRSRKACIMSSIRALEKAIACGTRLHVCHLTTAEEVHMVRAAKIQKAPVTAETSANYLWFCDEDYARLGARIKCNPAIKTANDRKLLRDALHDGIIDSIGSDHAPHLLSEKDAPYTRCPSGMPGIQQSLAVAVTVALQDETPLQRIAAAFSEKPAEIFGIKDRGCIKEGYIADLVAIDTEMEYEVGADGNPATSSDGSASKCGWTPYAGEKLHAGVTDVWLAGSRVVADGRMEAAAPCGQPLSF